MMGGVLKVSVSELELSPQRSTLRHESTPAHETLSHFFSRALSDVVSMKLDMGMAAIIWWMIVRLATRTLPQTEAINPPLCQPSF